MKKGDRVVLPFKSLAGTVIICEHDMESQCDNSNPNEAVE